MATPNNREEVIEEVVEHDDLCPICHLLFYQPVTTRCGHTLCSSCMAHWAEVSVTEQFQIVPLADEIIPMAQDQIEAKCPMCRTTTQAAPNQEREDALRERYPQTYEARKKEETEDEDATAEVMSMVLYVGNKHEYKAPARGSSHEGNTHEWTFFVRPERTDIIDEVRILLHPTFRPPEVVKRHAPYEIRRLGWGTFLVTAQVVLKYGYEWVSSDAQTVPESRKSLLPIEWMLSFEGEGAQGKARLKVRRERKSRSRTNVD